MKAARYTPGGLFSWAVQNHNAGQGRYWLCLSSSTSDSGATMKFFPHALVIAAAASAAVAAPAMAQAIKPGLWETKNKVGGAAGSKMQEAMAMVQQQMASMPPEQRAKIEAMMGRQGVVVNNDGVVAKVCITPEMAARQQFPMQKQGNGNCDYQHGPMVGDTMKFSFTCTNGSGNGSATFTSPTAYTSNTRMTSNVTGASETVEVASTGRWLAADCGAVKPLAAPPATQ
jgi:hypothetical protein